MQAAQAEPTNPSLPKSKDFEIVSPCKIDDEKLLQMMMEDEDSVDSDDDASESEEDS